MAMTVVCPLCFTRITYKGSTAQGNRYDCEKGHTLLVVSTARLDNSTDDACEFTQLQPHEWRCTTHACTMLQTHEPVMCIENPKRRELERTR